LQTAEVKDITSQMYQTPNLTNTNDTLFDVFETDIAIFKTKKENTRATNRYTLMRDNRLTKEYRKSNRMTLKVKVDLEFSDSD